MKRDEEIREVQLGFKPVEEEKDSSSEIDTETQWDKLQKLPDSEYLLRTVYPVLY